MKLPVALAAVPIIALAPASLARAAEPRAPTAQWVVDFAEQQCVASRAYGTDDKPLILTLKPSPVGDVMQITLFLKLYSTEPAMEAPVTIGIDDAPPITAGLLSYSTSQRNMRAIRMNLPTAAFAPMRQAKTVSFKARGIVDESFALTHMPALMLQMDRCLADLQRYWNIDDADRLQTRAKPQQYLARYFTNDDYPIVSIRKGEGGIVAFALLIDETGRLADCTVTATSHVPVLDAQSCALLIRRAKFQPAVGADGKPAKDSLVNRVQWIMPD
ncbi:energy transducer TonB [Allosphingosinicella humi]